MHAQKPRCLNLSGLIKISRLALRISFTIILSTESWNNTTDCRMANRGSLLNSQGAAAAGRYGSGAVDNAAGGIVMRSFSTESEV